MVATYEQHNAGSMVTVVASRGRKADKNNIKAELLERFNYYNYFIKYFGNVPDMDLLVLVTPFLYIG